MTMTNRTNHSAPHTAFARPGTVPGRDAPNAGPDRQGFRLCRGFGHASLPPIGWPWTGERWAGAMPNVWPPDSGTGSHGPESAREVRARLSK